MFVWIIKDRLAKAAWGDTLPDPCFVVLVAAEYPNATVPLVDEDTPWNFPHMAHAVYLTLSHLAMGIYKDEATGKDKPVVVMCQQGLSRSVVVAALAAALWQGRGFWEIADDMKKQDPHILPHENLFPVAKRLFPYQFLEHSGGPSIDENFNVAMCAIRQAVDRGEKAIIIHSSSMVPNTRITHVTTDWIDYGDYTEIVIPRKRG